MRLSSVLWLEKGVMDCFRCQGLMVEIDMSDLSSQYRVSGWRCLLCGEMTDSGIEINRTKNDSPSQHRPRVPGTPVTRTVKSGVRRTSYS